MQAVQDVRIGGRLSGAAYQFTLQGDDLQELNEWGPRVLRKLPDEAFKRQGTHNERGPVTLGDYLQHMVKHMEHHLKFIHAKRAAMGKEMW